MAQGWTTPRRMKGPVALLGDSLRLYGGAFVPMLNVMLLLTFLPLAVAVFLFVRGFMPAAAQGAQALRWSGAAPGWLNAWNADSVVLMLIAAGIMLASSIAFSPLQSGAVSLIALRKAAGGSLSSGEALLLAGKRWGRLTVLMLCWWLVSTAAAVVLMIPYVGGAVMMGLSLSHANPAFIVLSILLMAVGYFAMLAGMMCLTVAMQPAYPLALVEGKWRFENVKRCCALMFARGRFARVLGANVLVYLCAAALGMCAAPLMFLFQLVPGGFVVGPILSVLLGCLLTPFGGCLGVAVLQDARSAP